MVKKKDNVLAADGSAFRVVIVQMFALEGSMQTGPGTEGSGVCRCWWAVGFYGLV